MSSSPEDRVKQAGLKYFDLVGVAEAGVPPTLDKYASWIAQGRHGEMEYLKRHLDKKGNPSLLLPGARSWIVLARSYDTAEPLSIDLAAELKKEKKGWIARYARGRDYHEDLAQRHGKIIDELKSIFPDAHFLGCVDTKAVLERDAASQAGLGWIGKNTCLINQDLGSFLFISEILTTLTLTPDKPVADHCGTCARCLDACPTSALTAPRELDPLRCISYWTIEAKSPPPAGLEKKFGAQFFGCDICQDVCPWNQKARRLLDLPPMKESGLADVEKIAAQTDAEIKASTRGSAIARAKPESLRRNARRVIANT